MVVGDTGVPASHVVWQWVTSHRWPGWRVEVMTADESDIHWGETPRPVEWIPPWQRAAGVPEAESVTSFKVASDPRPMLGSRSDADLIVVGRASDPRVETLGGTTEWLLHHPPSPMVIVGQPDPARRVTVCADG